MFVSCECCVLSGRGLCDGFITRPEESYQLWRVAVFDQETSKTRRLKPATGLWKIQPQWVVTPGKQINNKNKPNKQTKKLDPGKEFSSDFTTSPIFSKTFLVLVFHWFTVFNPFCIIPSFILWIFSIQFFPPVKMKLT
jgi:hypothetical protein